MSGTDIERLAHLLSLAHAPGPQMAQATEELFRCERCSGFGLALLQLLQSTAIELGVRQAGAIYLKNFVKRCWALSSAEFAFPTSDREVIREALLPLALQAPRHVSAQLLAAMEEIAAAEFPQDWPTLLSDLSRQLLAADGPSRQQVVLEAAHAIFRRYRQPGAPRSPDALREVRHCAEVFGAAHLQVWKAACEQALCSGAAPAQLEVLWGVLRLAVVVFHDLSAHVLPAFFAEHRSAYFEGMVALLACRGPAPSAGASPGTLEMLQTEVCAVLSLYASRYEEQLGSSVGPAVKAVWDLVNACGDCVELDRLVAAGISFLATAAGTEWQTSPFADSAALQAICERIVLPNIRLRASDIELCREEPREYIVRDIEGGDEETRRRSAMDLVRALRRFHNAVVCEVCAGYVARLLEQAKSADEEHEILCLDTCLHLVIALASNGSKDGGLNASIVEQFFVSQVEPELQAAQMSANRALFRASCLKFVGQMRTRLPKPCLLAILPAVSRHSLAENPVVHTYAAVCANLVTTVQEPTGPDGQRVRVFDAATLRPSLLPMLLPMCQILAAGTGILQNEYLARAILTILDFLRDQAIEVAPQALQFFVGMIGGLSPRNPEFTHAMFECCAVLLKLLVPSGVAEVEALVLPALGAVLERGAEELLPYCFQVLGLLLDLHPAPAAPSAYTELFARILAEDVWRPIGNVPGLIRLMRAYFGKHAVFGALLRANMQLVFERFHYVLGNRKMGARAFELLNAVLRLLPTDMYHQYFETALTLALARIQPKRASDLEKEFVVSLSLFVYMQPDPEALPSVFERIQPQLLPQFLAKVWLPSTSKVLLLQRRKVCLVGLAKLMTCRGVSSDPQLLATCCESLAGLLRWRNAGLLCWLSCVVFPRLRGDDPEEAPQYEAAFCRLMHCEPAPPHAAAMESAGWDMFPNIGNRAAAMAVVRELLTPLRPAIQALEKVPPALGEVWQ